MSATGPVLPSPGPHPRGPRPTGAGAPPRRRRSPLRVALLLAGLVDLLLLVVLADRLGVGLTLLYLVATAVLGGWLLARTGLRAARDLRDALRERRPPGRAVLDAGLLLTAGLLVLAPGPGSDVVALVLLLPPTRALVRRAALRRIGGRIDRYPAGFSAAGPVAGFGWPGGTTGPDARRPGDRSGDPTVVRGEVVDED